MSIADEVGVVYVVNEPEKLLELDNDELLSILKSTYISRCLNEDSRALVDKDEMCLFETHIAQLNDGIIFLKDHLSKVFTVEDIENELKKVYLRDGD